jgi:hypothetical protein
MITQSLPRPHLGEALATDPFRVREQFTDEQWEHFITTRRFVDEEVLPASTSTFPPERVGDRAEPPSEPPRGGDPRAGSPKIAANMRATKELWDPLGALTRELRARGCGRVVLS